MQLLRLRPPWTQMLKLRTLSWVTEAAGRAAREAKRKARIRASPRAFGGNAQDRGPAFV